MQPHRGFESLRRHRYSEPGLSYFVTICTADRNEGLTAAALASAIHHEINSCETDGHWRARACVIMPDHLHLLIALVGDLPLGRVVARLKAKTKPALAARALIWQKNYYEHRLRDGDRVDDVLRYLFLNPYRAALLDVSTIYPWFWLGVEEARWFSPTLDDNRPLPEWLM